MATTAPVLPAFEIDEARLSRELAELATMTSVEPSAVGTAVTRVVFTSDDHTARAWLKGLADEEGFSVRADAVGNTFFRWEGADPKLAAIASGSHVDAIPHAGMYDGTVGVLGGLEAMRALKAAGLKPLRSIELVLLTSEEPTRFGIGCLGSRLIAGVLDAARADSLPDLMPKAEVGATLATVRAEAGFCGPLESCRLEAGHYAGWVELHIEQGPLLEREGMPLGIVTSIAAPAGYRFTIEGVGGHAGALLMPDRRDALCAASEVILSIERHTLAANAASGTNDTVATVGTCDVHPGAVNSVPSRVTLQLDIRDTDPERRESVMQSVRADIDGISERRAVTIKEEFVNADAPATSGAGIVQAIEEACAAEKIVAKKMVSRAYHDSSFMARIAPVAMIFIPSRNGVSHRPDEYSSPESIALGTRILALTLAKLASA
ncbi:M20 family metallo-hydrolase [Granulicella sibirica]|uniref:N-carbamoyl-L-amino acid hydrolase n=1 Tax=Granulicella sibirica TaxID=2479048 RepID=A0A4Q0T0T5_9BACT|nr:M20 family metallo-hydrolase [Granulicella sibirica]RXH55006.1 N-carbamoyl-L-amino acid hydrolase [Granulicella sibirica]